MQLMFDQNSNQFSSKEAAGLQFIAQGKATKPQQQSHPSSSLDEFYQNEYVAIKGLV